MPSIMAPVRGALKSEMSFCNVSSLGSSPGSRKCSSHMILAVAFSMIVSLFLPSFASLALQHLVDVDATGRKTRSLQRRRRKKHQLSLRKIRY